MSGIASIFIVALALPALAPLTAFAGTCAQRCETNAKQQKAQCDAEAARVKANDAARSAKSSAQNQNPNQQTGASSLSGDTAAQQADTQNAANKCRANENNCRSKCDEEKAKIPKDKSCKGDEGAIEGTKGGICAMIGAMAGELQQAANNLGGDNQAANNTKGNTGGMPPIPPIPPKKDDEKKSATDDPTANKPMVCGSDSTTTRYSDCNDFYVNKCSGNMGQDGCDQFISRYCGPMNGGASGTSTQQNPSADSNFLTGTVRNPATANLVADKQGEGMGSEFCGKANGYRFCQTSGRENCPSCQSITNWSTSLSSDQLKSAQNACPSDPMFSDPAVVAQINQAETPATPKDPDQPLDMKEASIQAAALAAGGSLGSSGQGTGAAGGKASLGNDEGIAEGVATGPGSLDLNSGSGGGGGYQSENEENSEESKPMGIQSATVRTPAGNLVSNSSDVANQYGPNLFSISTSTYKALCQRGRFLHCRER